MTSGCLGSSVKVTTYTPGDRRNCFEPWLYLPGLTIVCIPSKILASICVPQSRRKHSIYGRIKRLHPFLIYNRITSELHRYCMRKYSCIAWATTNYFWHDHTVRATLNDFGTEDMYFTSQPWRDDKTARAWYGIIHKTTRRITSHCENLYSNWRKHTRKTSGHYQERLVITLDRSTKISGPLILHFYESLPRVSIHFKSKHSPRSKDLASNLQVDSEF